MSDDEEAWIGCQRVADMPEPHVPSQHGVCEMCGAVVWVAEHLTAEVAAKHGDAHLACLTCMPTDGDMEVLPGQIFAMAAAGMGRAEMATVFALAEMTGMPYLSEDVARETMHRIIASPIDQVRFETAAHRWLERVNAVLGGGPSS